MEEHMMPGQFTGKDLKKYVKDYVVYDLETTGVSARNDAIIEISAVKVINREVVDTFSTLVNPDRPIPSQASDVNGITDMMVFGAPFIDTALADFLDFIGDMVLVGHNIAAFDMKFIARDAINLYGREVHNDFVDTLPMSRRALPKLGHHRLVDLSAHFNISTEGAHRALNDCFMNQKVFEKIGEILEGEPVPETIICDLCNGEMVRRSGIYGEFMGCSNYPKCKNTKKL